MKSRKNLDRLSLNLVASGAIMGLMIACKNLTVASKNLDTPPSTELKYRYAVGESQSTKKEVFDVFPELDGPANFLKPRVLTSLAIQVTDTKSISVPDEKIKPGEYVKLVEPGTQLPLAIPVFIIEQPYGDSEVPAKLNLASTPTTSTTNSTSNPTGTAPTTKESPSTGTGTMPKPTTSTQAAPSTSTAQNTKSSGESTPKTQKPQGTAEQSKSVKVVTKEMEFKIPDYFECRVSSDPTRMQGPGHPLECRKLTNLRFQGMCYSIGDMSGSKALYDVTAKTCTVATTPTPIVITHDDKGFIDLIALYRKYSGR